VEKAIQHGICMVFRSSVRNRKNQRVGYPIYAESSVIPYTHYFL